MKIKIIILAVTLSAGCMTTLGKAYLDTESDPDVDRDIVDRDIRGDTVVDMADDDDGMAEDIIEDSVEDATENDVTSDGDVSVYVMGNPGGDCNAKCAELGLACLGRGSVGLDCHEHMENSTCLLENCWVWMDLSPPEGRGNCGAGCGECNVCNRNDDVNYSFCCECG